MSDLSVRPKQRAFQRAADALLRGLGGDEVLLRMPMAAAGAIGEQLGAPTAGFGDLSLGPGVFRRARVQMNDGGDDKYELQISASAVEAQVSQLGLTSADVLFATAVGLTVADEFFVIEAVSADSALGIACLYRVLLRAASLQTY